MNRSSVKTWGLRAMITFQENQWIRKMPGYWIISAPVVVFSVYGLISLAGANVEDQIKNSLIVFCSIPILLFVFGFFTNLKTTYTEKEILVRFYPLPFLRRKIEWSQINKAYVRKFDWHEFKATGLGAIPLGNRGIAYHLYGEYGLQIETTHGDKILIGTRKPKSLQEFLKRMHKF